MKKIRIRDPYKHPGSATLPLRLLFVLVDAIGTEPVFEQDPDLLLIKEFLNVH
jgi:hypothetical protein